MPIKKILIVTSKMIMGGVETALIELLNKIDKQKYEITLLLTKPKGVLEDRIPTGIRITYLDGLEQTGHRKKTYNIFEEIKICFFRVMTHIHSEYYANSYWSVKTWPKFPYQYDCIIAYKADDAIVSMLPTRFVAKTRVLWIHAEFPKEKSVVRSYKK